MGALESEIADENRKREIKAEMQKSVKDALQFVNSINDKKMKRAQAYFKQLEIEHKDDVAAYGRLKRINATSYYQSIVDKVGNATYLLKVEYLPDGPFGAVQTVTVLSESGEDIVLSKIKLSY